MNEDLTRGKQVQTVNNDTKIGAATGWKPEEVAIIKNTVAKGTTDLELSFFLSVAKSVNLNPFTREIWCYKDNKNNVLVFAGRDGFLKIAQRDTRWNGMTSFEVCENDEFEMDVTAGKVTHKPKFKGRGPIIGAYAILKPKGCEMPTVEWADMATYNKGWNAWKTNPADMIKKTAESHGLKKAHGITGLNSEYDFEIRNEIALPVGGEVKSDVDIAKDKIIEALDAYQGEDRETIQAMCSDKAKSGEFDLQFAKEIGKQIGLEL
ncbi:MAG: RecT family recombinase [Candidatus Omnitrophota bacterium]